VYLLPDWYNNLFVVVSWNDAFPAPFKGGSEVRQGSSLSPSLFNVFINKVIMDLKRFDLGCYVNKTWIGSVLYADDIICLSASLSSLRTMLNRVHSVHHSVPTYLPAITRTCAL